MSKQETEQKEHHEEPQRLVDELDPTTALYAMVLDNQETIANLRIQGEAKDSALKGVLDAGVDVDKLVTERMNWERRNHGTMWRAVVARGKGAFKVATWMIVIAVVVGAYIYLQANPGLRDSIGASYSANPYGWMFIIFCVLITSCYLYIRFGRRRRR